VRLKALFIGFSHERVKKVVAAIEAAAEITIAAAAHRRLSPKVAKQLDDFHVVFVNSGLEDRVLAGALTTIRKCHSGLPVALVYGQEPDGKDFLLANRFDCQLFSELDHLGRTLTPNEIGEELLMRLAGAEIERRLMEISCCTGPCSTGH
jgi:hypothetical protein